MPLDTFLELAAWFFGALFVALLGYLTWIGRRLHAKVEDAASRKDLENSETKLLTVIAEKETAATKEILSVKEDTRSMADSVVTAVKSLEDRLDTLMFHLMNQGGKK